MSIYDVIYINLSIPILLTLGLVALIVFKVFLGSFSAKDSQTSFKSILKMLGALAITFFAIWGATKLFKIDFYVAYQLMTFGQCLCIND